MTVSIRMGLGAGLTAGLVAGLVASATIPTSAPALTEPRGVAVPIELSAYELSAHELGAYKQAAVAGVTTSPGDVIISAYYAIQPWVAYGVELATWAAEYLPWPIDLIAPQVNIIYNGWQPFAESVAYSLAFLVDGQFDLVVPILTNGIQTGINTFVQGEVQWVLSFLPPLPPLPGLPFAAVSPRAATSGSAAAARTPTAAAVTAGTETAGADADSALPQATRPAGRGRVHLPRATPTAATNPAPQPAQSTGASRNAHRGGAAAASRKAA
ncbi:MAG: hypothetical protein ACOYBX_07000 [Mycobacterium sp.]